MVPWAKALLFSFFQDTIACSVMESIILDRVHAAPVPAWLAYTKATFLCSSSHVHFPSGLSSMPPSSIDSGTPLSISSANVTGCTLLLQRIAGELLVVRLQM